MTNIKNFNAIVGIPTRKGIEEWKKQEVNSSISQKNYYSDYEQMLSYDWEGDEEIFISEEECSKSFIKPKILGCNENEEVLPNL